MPDTMTPDAQRRDPDASLEWMRQIRAQQRENESSNGVLRNIYKRAKSSGENVTVMRRVVKKLRMHSPEEIIADLQAEIYYLNLRKVGVTSQTLFTDLDLYVTESGSAAEAMFMAQERGYQAGRLATKVEECPYQPGTELHVAWMEYWRQGQEAIAREMGPDAKQADGSRQHPKRARQQRLPGTDDAAAPPVNGNGNDRAKPKRKAKTRPKSARGAAARRRRAQRPADQTEDRTPLH
jgi:ribosome modulation factor